jgi:exodeoxyribonuclease-3
MTKIISWNVNGLRAILKKNFLEFLRDSVPDILCVQETKTNQCLPLGLVDYVEFWQCGERAGYSGVLTLIKKEVAKNWQRFSVPTDEKYELLHREGRVVAVENNNLILFNV